MNYYILLSVSLGLNCVLLIILFSPNLNYFFNKKWFVWRDQHMSFEDWKKSEGFVSYHANKKDSFQLTLLYTNDMFTGISEIQVQEMYENYLKTIIFDKNNYISKQTLNALNDSHQFEKSISKEEYRLKIMNKLKLDHE